MKNLKFLWIALTLVFALVFVGCEPEPEDEDPVQFKVTITGTAPDFSNAKYNLWGASLLDPDDITKSAATGMPDATGKSFTFYVPNADQMPTETLFDTFGTYFFALAESNYDGDKDGRIYVYNGDIPITFSENNTTITNLDWEDFIPLSEFIAGQNEPTQFKLTVTGLGKAMNSMWGASLMTDTGQDTVVAIAMGQKDGGESLTFNFAVANEGMPVPGSKYDVEDEYYIGLSDVNFSEPTNLVNAFLLFKDGLPLQVSFTQDEPEVTFAKADFKPVVPQFRLTVANLPEPNDGYVWGATLMEGMTPKAIGALNGDGTCIFYVADGEMPTEDLFSTAGTYTVAIAQATPAGDKDFSTINMKIGATFNADSWSLNLDYETDF